MTTLEVIKKLCIKEGISISSLEKELGFGNGSLSKAVKIPADRILKIAERFHVSMEYVMTGVEKDDNDYAKDERERELLLLCRNASGNEKEKEAIVDMFKSTIDIYKKARGIE